MSFEASWEVAAAVLAGAVAAWLLRWPARALRGPARRAAGALGVILVRSSRVPRGTEPSAPSGAGWSDAVVLAGLALVSFGAWQIAAPAGYIVGGSGLAALALLADLGQRRARRRSGGE